MTTDTVDTTADITPAIVPFASSNERFNQAIQMVLDQHVDSSSAQMHVIDRMRLTIARHMGLRYEVGAEYLRYYTPIEGMGEKLRAWLKTNGWELVASNQTLRSNPLENKQSDDDDDEDYYFEDYNQDNIFALYFHPEQEMLMRISSNERMISPTLHADQENVAHTVIKALTEEFPPNSMPPATDDKVDVYFWNDSEYGPQANVQQLDCPKWNEIEDNYAPEIRERLAKLMDHNPDKAGIVLWSGIPGTGKTTALRSMLQEWREYSSAHLIIDPEVMLNKPSYMQHLLVNASGDDALILILEDSGELIDKSARGRVGQGLSRLLNMTDGLLGQGRKVIIVITTNEKQEELHEAVARPGRGLQNLDFRPLNEAEIAEWCKNKGIEPPDECDGSIAALYEHARENKSNL